MDATQNFFNISRRILYATLRRNAPSLNRLEQMIPECPFR